MSILSKRKRLHDWEQRLFTFLNDVRHEQMAWGRFDCAVGLVCGAVQAQTGVDLSIGHKDAYSDEKSAMAYLKKNGWAKQGDTMHDRLAAMMDSFLTRSPEGQRHRGNILLLDSSEGAGFGIRLGRKAAHLTPIGLQQSLIVGRPLEWAVV